MGAFALAMAALGLASFFIRRRCAACAEPAPALLVYSSGCSPWMGCTAQAQDYVGTTYIGCHPVQAGNHAPTVPPSQATPLARTSFAQAGRSSLKRRGIVAQLELSLAKALEEGDAERSLGAAAEGPGR